MSDKLEETIKTLIVKVEFKNAIPDDIKIVNNIDTSLLHSFTESGFESIQNTNDATFNHFLLNQDDLNEMNKLIKEIHDSDIVQLKRKLDSFP